MAGGASGVLALPLLGHQGHACLFAMRGEGSAPNRGNLADRDLAARVIEEGLNIAERCGRGFLGEDHQAANALVT